MKEVELLGSPRDDRLCDSMTWSLHCAFLRHVCAAIRSSAVPSIRPKKVCGDSTKRWANYSLQLTGDRSMSQFSRACEIVAGCRILRSGEFLSTHAWPWCLSKPIIG